MTERNAYKRYLAYQDQVKSIASGKGWMASKTMLIINILNGYLVFPLQEEPK